MSFLIASGHVEVEAKTDKAKSQITALIGAMGGLGPVAGAAAASMAAAGAGVAAFGVAAGKQIAEMKKASEAQKKYQDAVAASGKGSVEAAKAQREYQRMLGAMPKATQEASVAFQSLKDSYSDWSDSLAGDTMPVFTKSFAIFQAMLPKTTGLVQGTSRELDRLMTVIAGGVASPGFDTFMGKVENLSTSTLHSMTNGLIDMSRSLASFSAAGGFDEFIATAKEAGPLVSDTLANLAELALNLTSAGGDLGVSMLTVANALAELANAVPPEVLGTLVQLYASLKLVSVGIAAVNTVATSAAAANLANFIRSARFAGVGPAVSGVVQQMTRLQKVSIGLGALGLVAYGINELADASRGAPPDVDKLTASLKELSASGKWTGELKATFGDMDGFVAKLGKLKTESAALEKAKPFTAFSGLGAFTDTAVTKLDDLVRGSKSVGATKDDFKSFDQGLAAMATNGYANQAAEQFRGFKAAALAGGMSLKEFNAAFPEYNAAAAGLKAEAQLAAQGMGIFGQQALNTKAKLDAQKASADGLRASLLALNDVNRSAYDAQIAFEAGIDALTASFREHGATLNLDTAAGQANGKAMSEAAKGHDEMVASGLAAGNSFESMVGKSQKLRAEMMQLATKAFGGNTKAATEYVNKLLGIPSEVKTLIKAERAEAISGLQAVQAAIQKTPGAKSVTVTTLNAAAIKALEAVGYKTRTLEDGRTEVTTKNGQAIGSIGAVRSALDRLDGKTANTYTNHHTTNYVSTITKETFYKVPLMKRDGGLVRGYAGGGSIQHFPNGGYIDGPGTGTSDSIFALMGSGASAMVSNTEFVVNARETAKHLPLLEMINAGRLPRFAKGGKLTAAQKAAQKAAAERRKDARGFLTGQSTLTDMSVFAGVQNAEISSKLGKERSESALVDFLNQLQTQVSKAGFSSKTNKALQSQITASAKKLFAQNDAYDKVTASLEKAKSSLDDLKGKFDSLKTSVSSSLVGFANITKVGKYGTSPETLIKQLSMDTSRTTEFAKQLEALKGKGLNATAIADIAGAGVTGGMATAQTLLSATPDQIAQINALQKQLETSASKAGTITADAMYGAGIKAGEGLVAGLTAQQKAIETAMMTIAKAMEKSIKKALGIKSPSKLMEPVGEFSAMGVEVGWTKRLAKGSTLLSGNVGGLRTRPALAGASGGTATATMAPVVNLTVNVTSNDLLTSAARRKAFAVMLAKDTNDALLDYQKGRRR